MNVLITGATGLIGSHLVAYLRSRAQGTLRATSRDPDAASRTLGDDLDVVEWHSSEAPAPASAFDGIDTVIHLAGDNIGAGRWNEAKKRAIIDSRVLGTRNLVAGMVAAPSPPGVLVSASAIGYYGDRGDEELRETSSPGTDFLARVCVGAEAEAAGARAHGVRVVPIRTGIVLARGGGALGRMVPLFKLGGGGRLGHGRQWMSWIHVDDEVGLLLHAASTEAIDGPMNAVAPAPVRNRELTRALGTALHRPTFFPAPRFALRLALGEMADTVLGSQRVVPEVAMASGYRFVHPEINGALTSLV